MQESPSALVHDGSRSILLAYGDGDVRDAITELLRLEGYPVQVAAHGRQALELLLRMHPPKLLLLGTFLWHLDERQLLEEAQRAGRLASTAVILLRTCRQRPPPPGLAAVLDLPCDMGELLATVRRYADEQAPAAPAPRRGERGRPVSDISRADAHGPARIAERT